MNGSWSWIVGGLLLVGVILVVRKVQDEKYIAPSKVESESVSDNSDQQKKDVQLKLEELIQSFQKEAFGYALFLESNKQDLPFTQKTKLFEKYEKIMACPYIAFSKEFKNLGKDFDLVNVCVEEYMLQHKLSFNIEERITPQLEEAFMKKAEQEAKQVIVEFLKA